jgi:hypothetical protein
LGLLPQLLFPDRLSRLHFKPANPPVFSFLSAWIFIPCRLIAGDARCPVGTRSRRPLPDPFPLAGPYRSRLPRLPPAGLRPSPAAAPYRSQALDEVPAFPRLPPFLSRLVQAAFVCGQVSDIPAGFFDGLKRTVGMEGMEWRGKTERWMVNPGLIRPNYAAHKGSLSEVGCVPGPGWLSV